MSNLPNSERYSHIPTAEIVTLFNQGLSHRMIGRRIHMGPCSVGSRLRKLGLVHPRARVTAAQLKEARLDPAWEARHGIADRVICRECGGLKSQIDAWGEHSHLRKHRITARDYKRKYPGARLTNFRVAAGQAARQGRSKTLEELMDEFASMYATPEDLKKCRRDPRGWEEKHGINDVVIGRMCGLKSRSDLWAHLRKAHDLSYVSYHAQFCKAPTIPQRLKEVKNEDQQDRGNRLRMRAALSSESETTRKIVLYLWDHPDATNPEVRNATGTKMSDRQTSRVRDKYGVSGRKRKNV
jgi:hypothetical protein